MIVILPAFFTNEYIAPPTAHGALLTPKNLLFSCQVLSFHPSVAHSAVSAVVLQLHSVLRTLVNFCSLLSYMDTFISWRRFVCNAISQAVETKVTLLAVTWHKSCSPHPVWAL